MCDKSERQGEQATPHRTGREVWYLSVSTIGFHGIIKKKEAPCLRVRARPYGDSPCGRLSERGDETETREEASGLWGPDPIPIP